MKNFKQILTYTYEQKKIRKWDKIYWAIDLHDTIIEGKYNKLSQGASIFHYAKETLDYLYNSEFHRTILWTSSYPEAVNDILKRFDLKFNYFNANPECPNNELCHFDNKFYFNLLLDDKSGFESSDWKVIHETLMILDNA